MMSDLGVSKLTNGSNGDNILMKKIEDNTLPPPISDKKFSLIRKSLKSKGVKIFQNEESRKYLDMIGAEASISSDGKMIYLRPGRNPSASAIYEELRHLWQIEKKGKITSTADYVEVWNREIKAKEYLLSHAEKLELTDLDIEQTKNSLKYYLNLLDKVGGKKK